MIWINFPDLYGAKESAHYAWEQPEQTLEPIHKFMKNGLCVEDPFKITLVDFYRLPQYPVHNDRKVKINRSIIIKLTNSSDKCRMNLCRFKKFKALPPG